MAIEGTVPGRRSGTSVAKPSDIECSGSRLVSMFVDGRKPARRSRVMPNSPQGRASGRYASRISRSTVLPSFESCSLRGESSSGSQGHRAVPETLVVPVRTHGRPPLRASRRLS